MKTLSCFTTIAAILFSSSTRCQIDCASFKSIPLDPKIKTHYIDWNLLYGVRFLHLFSTSDQYLYLTSFQPEEIHIEMYTTELELIKKNDITVQQNKKNSYYGIQQLGEHIYVIYLEHPDGDSKMAVLYAQEFDLATLALKPEKIEIFSTNDDMHFPEHMIEGEFKSSLLVLRFSSDYNYLGIFLQDKNEEGKIEFSVSVFDADLKQKFSTLVVTDSDVKRYVRTEFSVGLNGNAAITNTTEEKSTYARHPFHSGEVYSIVPKQSGATIKKYELETDEYSSLETVPIILDNRLFVYAKLHNFGDETWEYTYKFFIYDLFSDAAPSILSAMIFEYLPENEINGFNKPDKGGGYISRSREFTLSGLYTDPEGNIYMCFNYFFDHDNRDNLNTAYTAYPRYLDNPKGLPVNIPVVLKFDKNLTSEWAHMIYFSEFPVDEIIFENSNGHLLELSYSEIALATDLNFKEKRKENISAGNNKNQVRGDIKFDPDGNFTISNIDENCNLKLGQRNWSRLEYFSNFGKCYVIMGGEGKDESLYLTSFKFSD